MLYRNGIWFKLIQTGVSTKMIRMLKSLYKNVKCCVNVNGALTENFETYMGVKQEEPLSPLLFILFVNDMYQCLQSPEVPAFILNAIQIYLLLFADDTVIVSYSKEGLQTLLNKLYNYCNYWGVSVNTEKTVVMVFKKGNNIEDVALYYDNQLLKVVKTFTYLGVTLSSNGIF